MTSLLVELQTEELPPKALKKLSEAFAQNLTKSLASQHFLEAGSETTVFGSPRRLAALVTCVLAKSPDEPFKQKLVPVKVGLDADGNPTAALQKKMKALGIEADVKSLKCVDDGKNEQLFYEGIRPGVELVQGLQTALEAAAFNLPIPKVMHYQLQDGVTTVSFVRPAKHLVALYGADVVPVSLLGLKADRLTSGHRFHTHELISLRSADDYEAQMMTEAKVMPSFAKRREKIVHDVKEAACAIGGEAIMPEDLIDEVTALTEWPVIYQSSFEEEFLKVPQECLILTMQQNQKYFAVQDEKGRLMNRFFLVSQLEAKDGGKEISAGNARVVRARLADAKFFYDQDRLQTLESRIPLLKNVVYHNKLGTQAERVERVKAIAAKVADLIGANREEAVRAAQLAKVDLLTQMVGEFPELQGIMGEYYALHDGEGEEVALAIREHYQPRFAGDALPSTLVSLAVALADKLETLSGLFGIGQMPTGDKDPFALRRHALGVLRMLIEKRLNVAITDLVDIGYEAMKSVANIKDARADLLAFFEDRIRVMFKDKGYSAQEVDAVLATHPTMVLDVPARLEAVRAFTQLPEADALAAANKRIGNIIKKTVPQTDVVDAALFDSEAEKVLYDALQTAESSVKVDYDAGRYTELLKSLAPMKAPVDRFFEDVMVNVDDERVRANRLALLWRLHRTMNMVAELSRLAK
ncbi:MAG TPA: glycine--tRNA ligase subunit beta [Candidatus Aphodousia faecigallinarum]|uniref:Glycine--tRNA ligase beta subunit n=1 Tax=Candidatus Aphodousia faecigallinarum TaxID=2840677 RepID=A0A9D1IJV2_9BURK|nr:glycine--tRNA ligase subunit beta [Candidatus Aphodousia faecigallinarum]